MAEVRFTRRALRDVRKLSPQARRAVEVTLDRLIDDPTSGDPLAGAWRGYWKIRTGDFRIIYRIANRDVVEVQYGRSLPEPPRTSPAS
jgi:addiction module RelE/StbE family toxin